MKKFTVALAVISLAACNQRKESSLQIGEPEEIVTKTYEQLEKADWLLGEWENASAKGSLTETWKQENDSTFIGETFFTAPIDTIFHENFVLQQKNDSLIYNVTVKGQNNDKPVPFYMTSIDDEQVVFENPKHDFPSKITYYLISSDSLVAEISGMKDGKESKESYPMKKK
ncbi:MAG TPA: DUF6265 family protein [Flavobacterium sp.]|uniref:DUF6265 family protein n=1 Tax=Flavobacterium sp. TaxID=239 RepID=UPI002CB1925D|nr:DUF6265 family protein [Flavobacterium sp.]HSD15352.1 DUF6265 family protein [Flavobacterium sp.]